MIHTRRLKNILGAALTALSVSVTFSAMADSSIALPGDTLFPEGIAADRQGGLFVGSLTEGRILYLAPESRAAKVFVSDGLNGLMSVTGILVSTDGKTLFVCNSDLGISTFKGTSKPGLVAFDAKSGVFKGRWEFPGGGLCNDLTMTPDGTILMTDSFTPRILALKPGAVELSQWVTDERFKGEGINLNGITWSENGVYTVKYNSNELFRVVMNEDGSAGVIDKINLSRALDEPDGIKTLASGALLVVEGAGRLAKINISGLEGVVETVGEGFNVPTTATIIGEEAYVVEGQLDHLPIRDNKAGEPDPFTLKVVQLP